MSAGAKVAAAVAALAVAGGAAWYAIDRGVGPLPDPELCTATAAGHTVGLTAEQAKNASVIAAVAIRRGLPARAVSIGLSAAYQESKLENLRHGDRDSLGLFQQRPSQGWGRRDQLLDPHYAAGAFYDALVQVPEYDSLPITRAAQQVQRSAFPDAYADHALDGRTIASALSGYSEAAFSCVVHAQDLPSEQMNRHGLTPRAAAVKRDLRRSFGRLPLGGFAPGGVSMGHMRGSAHYEGRAIDVFFRPVSAVNKRYGWAVAHYLVANADRLHVQHVIFDGRIWTAGSASEAGWRRYTPPEGRSPDPATERILEHRDHVHVDVY